MANFKRTYKARSMVGTIHRKNLENLGLDEKDIKDPVYVGNILKNLWEDSGQKRQAGVAVCYSEKECYHAHIAVSAYNSTTLGYVSKLLGNAHIEPVLGTKEQLVDYLLKKPPYDESGEEILYQCGLEDITIHSPKATKKSPLLEIRDFIAEGYTPSQIFAKDIHYRRYEKIVKSTYLQSRIDATPIMKEDLFVEYHFGSSGTGKSYEYIKIAEELGAENIYMYSDHANGGLDYYIENGCPDVLFMDELKDGIDFSTLLIMLDKYSGHQIHSRYVNCFNLWKRVYITSIYSPEELYNILVPDTEDRINNSYEQLRRRIHSIVYHYKQGEEFKTIQMDMKDYINRYSITCTPEQKLTPEEEQEIIKMFGV